MFFGDCPKVMCETHLAEKIHAIEYMMTEGLELFRAPKPFVGELFVGTPKILIDDNV